MHPGISAYQHPRPRRALAMPRWFAMLTVLYTTLLAFVLTAVAGSLLDEQSHRGYNETIAEHVGSTPLIVWLTAATIAACVARLTATVVARAAQRSGR